MFTPPLTNRTNPLLFKDSGVWFRQLEGLERERKGEKEREREREREGVREKERERE